MGAVWSYLFGSKGGVSSKYNDDLQFVKSYQPQNHEVTHLRILLHGPIGAGKSSFINSVNSVLQNRVTGRAQTDAITKTSFTKKYKTFKFDKGQGTTYSFVFNDIMGYETESDSGVPVGDVKLALRGHVEEDYRFNPSQGLMEGDLGYNSHPTLEDKVHVLVCVVPVSSVAVLDDGIVAKLREVRMAASDLGIPQMAVLTKVDEVEGAYNTDKSKYLKEQIDKFHMLLGIPVNCIFLVVNYVKERELNDGMSKAIMCALRQMVSFGEDYLNDL